MPLEAVDRVSLSFNRGDENFSLSVSIVRQDIEERGQRGVFCRGQLNQHRVQTEIISIIDAPFVVVHGDRFFREDVKDILGRLAEHSRALGGRSEFQRARRESIAARALIVTESCFQSRIAPRE